MKTINTLIACLVMLSACCQAPENAQTAENETIGTIMTRRSIRKYKPETVSREILQEIIKCGIFAPSGENKQSWEVRIVDNPVLMEEIKDAIAAGHPDMPADAAKGCFRGAPVVAFIARDLSYPFSAFDCGLMAQNMMLAAKSLGVGSICLGRPVLFLTDNEVCKPVIEKFGFSEGYEFCLCVGFGYADETPQVKPRNMEKVKFMD